MGWEEAFPLVAGIFFSGTGREQSVGEMAQKNVCEKQNKAGASSERGFVSAPSASLGPSKQKGADSHEQLVAMKETIEKRTCPKCVINGKQSQDL